MYKNIIKAKERIDKFIIDTENKVTDEIVPSIINKVIYREYHYNEINSDNKVNDLPINSSNRSDTLLSTTNRFK